MTQYTEPCSSNIAVGAVEIDRGIRQAVVRWIDEQRLKRTLRQERQQLAQLSSQQLHDIGIDREAANAEAMRRDIPTTRRP